MIKRIQIDQEFVITLKDLVGSLRNNSDASRSTYLHLDSTQSDAASPRESQGCMLPSGNDSPNPPLLDVVPNTDCN